MKRCNLGEYVSIFPADDSVMNELPGSELPDSLTVGELAKAQPTENHKCHIPKHKTLGIKHEPYSSPLLISRKSVVLLMRRRHAAYAWFELLIQQGVWAIKYDSFCVDVQGQDFKKAGIQEDKSQFYRINIFVKLAIAFQELWLKIIFWKLRRYIFRVKTLNWSN